MAVEVEFDLLGPLVVRCQGVTVPLAQGRQRALLAALLLDSGYTLTTDQLIEVLWGAAPPVSARAALHNQVRRLRRVLGEVGGDRICTQPGGYVIRVEPGELDVTRMQDLLTSARTAARRGCWEEASATAASAILLWRGEPLADVNSQLLAGRISQLGELYLQAVETRLEAEVNLGRHAEAISELRRLTSDQPFREHAQALLMLALYRSGRQGDALAAYQAVRKVMVEELGIEPGPGLRELHRRILVGDQGLVAPCAESEKQLPTPIPATRAEPAELAGLEVAREHVTEVESEHARPEAPQQLPAGVRHFAGREEQLRTLADLLGEVGQPGRTVVISAIGGTAGIGKTALAVHWAHQAAAEFPDGQLYANLRGFDPSGPPTATEAVVRDFLSALGVPPGKIPASADAQAALYRTILTSRRVLIVLDNARDADQVRLLLPGSPDCFVIVTSRARLVSLAASEGAHLLTLDLPSIGEAREILSKRLGAERVAAEPDAADELIRLCARLPLALGIVAAQAAANPGVRLAALAAQLSDTAGRLDMLEAETEASGVRAAFSWSCQGLSDTAARLFRVMSIHFGPDMSAAAAASLVGLPRSMARLALRELVQVGLIAEHQPGRFALHDLVRIYAAEQFLASENATGAEPDSADPGNAALRRLLDHYLITGYTAAVVLNRHRVPIPLPAAQPAVVPEEIEEYGQALAWFETERQVLEAAVAAAAAAGLDVYAWKLAWTMVDFLNWRGYWHSHITIQHTGLEAAQRLGEAAAQATVHRGLSRAYAELGRMDRAREHLHRSLAIYCELGDLLGQGHAYMGLAVALEREGRYGEALASVLQSLDLYRSCQDQPGEAAALNAMGWCHAQLKEYQQAFHHSRRALALHQRLGNQLGAAYTWDTLGYIHHHLGEYAQAAECYQSALKLFQDLEISYSAADTLTHLGQTYRQAGDIEAARDAWKRALSILRALDHADAADVQAMLAGLRDPGPTAG